MSSFVIRRAAPMMPDGVGALQRESAEAGIRNVTALVERWENGTERYDAPGEALLAAVSSEGDNIVGVGGMNRCPDVHGALRVRRFYVAVSWRRRGVAQAIAAQLVAAATGHTSTITCNAGASAAAPPFWEAMGFEPADISGVTHVLRV